MTGYIESGKAEGAELVTGGDGANGGGLLRRPDAVHRDLRRPEDRARGDLRPGARGDALRLARGGRRARQRHRVRPGGRRVDALALERPQAGRDAEGRLGLHQPVGPGRRARRSAASRPRASAASTATPASTPTSRSRPSGRRWARHWAAALTPRGAARPETRAAGRRLGPRPRSADSARRRAAARPACRGARPRRARRRMGSP